MNLPIEFDRPVCGDLGEACSREWLETNGIGGFACSTIAGMNTRRYHALLTAATRPPVGRVVLLSKLEETLVIGEQRFELSVNQYWRGSSYWYGAPAWLRIPGKLPA
jgi:glycogen debranching enzyme